MGRWRLKLTTSLFGLIVIPVNDARLWISETYRNIPGNIVMFSKDGMTTKVHGSAGPLIYTLKVPEKLSGFHIQGELRGLPKFKDVTQQGNRGADDYPLRIGFVIPGEKRLNALQRLMAPDWVKNLYARAPEGTGIADIEFFNVTQNPKQLGSSRTHPMSDLIHETFFATVQEPGKFDLNYQFTSIIRASALWVSIDGDDTHSEFEVHIDKFELKTTD